jgi:hypothetical protein
VCGGGIVEQVCAEEGAEGGGEESEVFEHGVGGRGQAPRSFLSTNPKASGWAGSWRNTGWW